MYVNLSKIFAAPPPPPAPWCYVPGEKERERKMWTCFWENKCRWETRSLLRGTNLICVYIQIAVSHVCPFFTWGQTFRTGPLIDSQSFSIADHWPRSDKRPVDLTVTSSSLTAQRRQLTGKMFVFTCRFYLEEILYISYHVSF